MNKRVFFSFFDPDSQVHRVQKRKLKRHVTSNETCYPLLMPRERAVMPRQRMISYEFGQMGPSRLIVAQAKQREK